MTAHPPLNQLPRYVYWDHEFRGRMRRRPLPLRARLRECAVAVLTGFVLPVLALVSLTVAIVGIIFVVRGIAFVLRVLLS